MDDRELVDRASRGDTNAYAALVTKYSNAAYATAVSIVRDFHIAQDIAQEAFVKAWFKLNDLEDKSKFPGWLFMITRRLCLDWSKKKKKDENIESFPNIVDQHNVEEIVQRKHLQETVWHAVNQLDDTNRLVTVMYFISGFTAKEISSFLDVSLSAVESRIRRSKEKLKKELFNLMEQTFTSKKMGEEFRDDVMWRIVPRIATIEIPVSNVKQSIEWYGKILGTKAVFEGEQAAMLHLQGGNRTGVPTLYLVETKDHARLSFLNTNTNVVHSVIDFYIPDLERFHSFLTEQGVEVTGINYIPNMPGMGGFGFKDPNGNLLSVTNVTHQGQV